MLSSSWSIRLPHAPDGELARPIDLKGASWCLVYQTPGKQLFVHENNQSRPFAFQKEATCLEVYRFEEDMAVAVLCNNVLSSYNITNNRQYFSVEFEAASHLTAGPSNLYVAGLATVHCVNFEGSELWETHLSGNVACMTASADNYVFLGLEDKSIKIFLRDQMVIDYSNLASVPVCLCPVEKTIVMVGFREGNTAVYESKKPKWKAKSKHIPKQILMHQVETQKQKTAIVARDDGQVEMRSWIDGTIFSKTSMDEPINRMFIVDFRKEGQQQLLVLGKSGTLKGFNMLERVDQPKVMIGAEKDELQEAVAKLSNRKLDLEMEIEQLKRELQLPASESTEILRPDFSLKWRLSTKGKLQLKITCTNGTARGIVFHEDALPPYYQKAADKLTYELDATIEYFGKVHAQVLVSSYPTNEYELYPIEFELKKFWKWLPLLEPVPTPESSVTFKNPERVARYLKWLCQCFYLEYSEQEVDKLQEQAKLAVSLANFHDKGVLTVKVDSSTSVVSFHSENLQLLSQMIQDLSEYMSIRQLEVDGKFPREIVQLKQKLAEVEQLSKNKTSISSEITDAMNNIKSMIVRGENARLLRRMGDVRRIYTEIMEENHKIYLEIEKRSRNTVVLNELLRYVGQMITMAANMRIGTARTRVSTLCRNAVKTKHFLSIATIMEKGFE